MSKAHQGFQKAQQSRVALNNALSAHHRSFLIDYIPEAGDQDYVLQLLESTINLHFPQDHQTTCPQDQDYVCSRITYEQIQKWENDPKWRPVAEHFVETLKYSWNLSSVGIIGADQSQNTPPSQKLAGLYLMRTALLATNNMQKGRAPFTLPAEPTPQQ